LPSSLSSVCSIAARSVSDRTSRPTVHSASGVLGMVSSSERVVRGSFALEEPDNPFGGYERHRHRRTLRYSPGVPALHAGATRRAGEWCSVIRRSAAEWRWRSHPPTSRRGTDARLLPVPATPNRPLCLIFNCLIFDSNVDSATPTCAAAERGLETLPLVPERGASIISFS
jgi:hypothetical protein